jgi:hypothetical protein
MAHWTLECPNCKAVFTHSEIQTCSIQDDFTGIVPKPKFPNGGLGIVCPNCGSDSKHQRYELIYADF